MIDLHLAVAPAFEASGVEGAGVAVGGAVGGYGVAVARGVGVEMLPHAVLFHGGEIYARNHQPSGLEYFFALKTN